MTATTIKGKNKVEQFTEYLESSLTKQEYDNLSQLMGYTTTNRLSRLLNPSLNNLGGFNAAEISVLSTLLNVPPQDLIMEWGLGTTALSLDDAQNLVNSQGLMVDFVSHAA